jgi:hypothetical protein
MSGSRRKSKQRRGGGGRNNRTAPPAEFWRAAPEPPEPPDIVPAPDPTALLRSMGAPPLPGQREDSLITLGQVVLGAQRAAVALAASADLLDLGNDED